MKPILILTRPRAASLRFLEQLSTDARAALTPIIAPVMTIQPTQADVDLSTAEGVIFSSRNAVDVARVVKGMPAYCVGRATTEAALAKGWDARFMGVDAERLLDALSETDVQGPLVHLSGTHLRVDIAARLRELGHQARQIAVYDQVLSALAPEAKTALEGGKPVILPLFSPRTARHLATVAKGSALLHIICMSEAVAEAAEGMVACSVHIVEAPEAEQMAQAVELLAFRPTLG